VTSNDEIGYTGDIINEMTEGLRERERMQQSLNLAKEVQQRLLPQSAPRLPGWDIAGTSIYCDETGGDYYDYMDAGDGRLAVVVGDVSGHGLPAALLMATARSLLRQRVRLPGSIPDVLTDVNHLLVGDVGASGQFMTLFFLSLAPGEKCVHWMRAGHDPAVLYDPSTDAFSELKGEGIALGVDGEWRYRLHATCNLADEQIILVYTDGLHEARDEIGEMFGKDRLLKTVRSHAGRTASGILEAVMSELRQFQGRRAAEDDVTLVVVKAAKP
jgi:sigma-B regulation protein RsbU (phosphoserine phosphatase)